MLLLSTHVSQVDGDYVRAARQNGVSYLDDYTKFVITTTIQFDASQREEIDSLIQHDAIVEALMNKYPGYEKKTYTFKGSDLGYSGVAIRHTYQITAIYDHLVDLGIW